MSGPGGDIPLRIYSPKDIKEQLPVVLYIHGGGWIIGTNDSCAAASANLAFHTNMIVVAVGYRLAPEHPYPAAVEDSWAAVEWLINNAGNVFSTGESGTITIMNDNLFLVH